MGLPFPLPCLTLAGASSGCRALQLPCLPVLHRAGAVLLPAAAVCRQGGGVRAGQQCAGRAVSRALLPPVAMGTSTASPLTPSYCGGSIIPLAGLEEAGSGVVGAAPPSPARVPVESRVGEPWGTGGSQREGISSCRWRGSRQSRLSLSVPRPSASHPFSPSCQEAQACFPHPELGFTLSVPLQLRGWGWQEQDSAILSSWAG